MWHVHAAMVAVPLGANAFETRAHDVGKKTVLLEAVLVQQVLANTLLPGMMAMHTILYANCTYIWNIMYKVPQCCTTGYTFASRVRCMHCPSIRSRRSAAQIQPPGDHK